VVVVVARVVAGVVVATLEVAVGGTVVVSATVVVAALPSPAHDTTARAISESAIHLDTRGDGRSRPTDIPIRP
jgi:hypothetical protein